LQTGVARAAGRAYLKLDEAAKEFAMNAGDVQAGIAPPQNAGQALWRGFRGRCPACGEGRMFRAFLKVADQCPHCGEELHHHRADDFPAYLVIIITGHILVPIVLAVETTIAPAMWISMSLWPLMALIMTLSLLQPVKGAVVAIQWYGGMHGFEDAKKARSLAATGG
jgi:uncharacterized protein (DUF983 family)